MDIDYRVVEIAQKEGTPLYIFDVVTLKKRIDQIKNSRIFFSRTR